MAPDELAVELLPRAESIANKLARGSLVEAEELRAVAKLELLVEVRRFDFRKFDGYDPHGAILYRVKLRLIDWLRANGPVGRPGRSLLDRRMLSLDEVKLEDGTPYVETIPGPPDPDVPDTLDFLALLERLRGREREVLYAMVVAGRTEAELAEEYGVSPTRISHIRTRALRRLRGEDMHEELSVREAEVIRAAADGLTTNEIAEQLVLSVETVKSHKRRIIAKLHARSLAHAIALGFRDGILE